MCGIYCALSRHGHVLAPPDSLLAKLQSRGPDALRQHVVRVSPILCLTFTASVLSLRGDTVVPQPLVDADTGSVLCWNGEAWGIGGARVEGNDSEAVFRLLVDAARDSRRGVLDAFASIRGPYSCIFYDARRRELFFGRDVLGRRSMVRSMTSSGDFILCSVPDADATWTEVEADGMYVVSLSELSGSEDDTDPIAIRCPITYEADGELSGDCIVSEPCFLQAVLTRSESTIWSIK
jgi:asparagine synthetase B (glutamine-hydrolysing)